MLEGDEGGREEVVELSDGKNGRKSTVSHSPPWGTYRGEDPGTW